MAVSNYSPEELCKYGNLPETAITAIEEVLMNCDDFKKQVEDASIYLERTIEMLRNINQSIHEIAEQSGEQGINAELTKQLWETKGEIFDNITELESFVKTFEADGEPPVRVCSKTDQSQ